MTAGPGHGGEVGVIVSYTDGVLHVAGEIDLHSHNVLCDALAAHDDNPLHVDFREVTFCDSSCLNCLLRRVRNGGRVIIVGPRPNVRRALDVAGVVQDGLEVTDP